MGNKLASAIDEVLDEHPALVGLLTIGGADGRTHVREKYEDLLVSQMAKALQTEDVCRNPSGHWRPGLVDAFCKMSHDPEQLLPTWLRHGAPMGVAKEIPSSNVFPRVENNAEKLVEIRKFYARAEPSRNYKSVDENSVLFAKEIDRLAEAGFVKIYPSWQSLKAEFDEVVVSKVAAIVKQRPDGSTKLRIIVDMLQSMVNTFVRLGERVVLPRLFDVVSNLMVLILTAMSNPGFVVDQLVMDWSDAFHTLAAHKEEWSYQVLKAAADSFAVYLTVLFGGGGAPLVWGRVAAFMGRSGQSLFDHREVRMEIYVDDPWTGWAGTAHQIAKRQVRLIAWWICVGPNFSRDKAQRGALVRWIGANIILKPGWKMALELPKDFAGEIRQTAEDMLAVSTVPQNRVRRFAGKASWMGGFVPCVASMISPLWAALADVEEDLGSGNTDVAPIPRMFDRDLKRRRTHPTLTQREKEIPTTRIRVCLKWLIALIDRHRGSLSRTFDPVTHHAHAVVTITTDGSPWGMGGVITVNCWPHAWFAEDLSAEDVERFSLKTGSPNGQAVIETLALLFTVRAWLPVWKGQRVRIALQADSTAALGAWNREKSNCQPINSIVRELALDLAENRYTFDITQHLPGALNIWADALSRLGQPNSSKSIPQELLVVPRTHPEKRSHTWWETDAGP